MAKKDKKVLPPSGAGLVRYFEEETRGPKLTPEQVVIMAVLYNYLAPKIGSVKIEME